MKLLKSINDKENNKYSQLKLYNVIYDENKNLATLRFVYNYDSFTDSDRKRIQAHVEEYFKQAFKVKTKFKKYFIDEDIITVSLLNYIQNSFFGIAKDIDKNNIKVKKQDYGYKVAFTCDTPIYNYLIAANFIEKSTAFINKIMFDKIEIFLHEKSSNTTDILETRSTKLLKKYTEDIISDERIKVSPSNVMNLIGKIEKSKEVYLPEGQVFQSDNITIGGYVNYFTQNKYLSKQKDSNGKQIEKDYYTFELSYNDSAVRAIYFPRKNDVEKIKVLKNNKCILVNGILEGDDDRLTLKARNIAFASLPQIKKKEETQSFKDVNDSYQLIHPQPYQVVEQQFLFAENTVVSNFLKDNTFIVFDIETTGFDHVKDEITEIGAVKIINGEMVESFTTLVKPKQSIPKEVVDITGITDSMVKDAPSIEEVMPDFYKFCDGAILVAYNINFDYKFINHYGLKSGYKFKNKQIDAMYLARIGIPGLKRFTLKDAVTKLGITLTNAHRAMFDTVATAKLFLALSDHAS